jgi:hypothetical protein
MNKHRSEMKADQRSRICKAISLNIVINYDEVYSKRWKVHCLGLNGATVEMRRDELLPGTPMEAVLALKEHGECGLHRLPAELVRTDRNGVALWFRSYDDRAYTALVNLLYSA